jgi:hypothetical protein
MATLSALAAHCSCDRAGFRVDQLSGEPVAPGPVGEVGVVGRKALNDRAQKILDNARADFVSIATTGGVMWSRLRYRTCNVTR